MHWPKHSAFDEGSSSSNEPGCFQVVNEHLRVSLVRAMIRQPQVLLLDEPTERHRPSFTSHHFGRRSITFVRLQKMTLVIASHFDDEIAALEAVKDHAARCTDTSVV